jgi:predicted HAD superfamily Cof-like phosphohydrolase
MKTKHQKRIEQFMNLAGQDVPDKPIIPDEETRILRAKLIIEEALETVEALGVDINLVKYLGLKTDGQQLSRTSLFNTGSELEFNINGECDIKEVVDGCIDVSVVTRGTLSAFGVSDKELLKEVDKNNLAKFGPGGYRREDGKWCKPKDHQPPDIKGILEKQGYEFGDNNG